MYGLIIREEAGRCQVCWLGLGAAFGPEGLPRGWQAEVRTAPAKDALRQWLAAHGTRRATAPRPGEELGRVLGLRYPRGR